MINKKKFFNSIRASLFGGTLSISQVKQMLSILQEWERRGMHDLRQLADIFGTVYWETDKTMCPIEEYGKGKGRKYGQRVKMNGLPYIEPFIFYGRGHTQNTWWDNYNGLTNAARKQGKDWDFLRHPGLLLQTEPSIWATFHAMTTGMYTGKKLSDYFNDKVCDWTGARRIINGTDKAEEIAGISKKFYVALK